MFYFTLNLRFGASSSGSRGWDVGVFCPRRAWEFIPCLTVDVYGHPSGHREGDNDFIFFGLTSPFNEPNDRLSFDCGVLTNVSEIVFLFRSLVNVLSFLPSFYPLSLSIYFDFVFSLTLSN